MAVKKVPAISLAKKINTEHYAGEDAAGQAMEHFIKCGEYLIEAKAQVNHGEWLQWIEDHLDFSERTAHHYMTIARNSQRVADLGITTIRGALAAIKQAKDEAKAETSELIAFADNWLSFYDDKLVQEIEHNESNRLTNSASEEDIEKLVTARDCCYELAEFFNERIPNEVQQ